MRLFLLAMFALLGILATLMGYGIPTHTKGVDRIVGVITIINGLAMIVATFTLT